MTDKDILLSDLNDISEILNNNGYGKWCATIRKAVSLLKEQEAKWIHREDMDFIDKYDCNHFHGMCTNCGLVHDFIDGHTGQYLYCPQCGRSVK